eukprot:6347-Chlamydomonas_euryale.AAC.3
MACTLSARVIPPIPFAIPPTLPFGHTFHALSRAPPRTGHRRGGDPRRLRRRADARCAGRAVACERARAQHARVVRHLPRRRPARRDPRDEGQDAG